MPCETIELKLEKGDSLILFSDGLIEEPGADDSEVAGELYGLERVKQSVGRVGADAQAIHDELARWSGRSQFSDDLTILVIENSQ